MNCPRVLGEGLQAHKRCLHFLHPWVCIGLDGCDILCVSRSVSSNGGHTLLWLRKMCIWLRKGYVGHCKIWWGVWLHHSPMLALVHHHSNSAAPEFLQWWHIILLRTSFLGRGRTFFYNPSSFIIIFLRRHKKYFL
jgi:hypothetical protein